MRWISIEEDQPADFSRERELSRLIKREAEIEEIFIVNQYSVDSRHAFTHRMEGLSSRTPYTIRIKKNNRKEKFSEMEQNVDIKLRLKHKEFTEWNTLQGERKKGEI